MTIRTYRKAGETIRAEKTRATLGLLHISEHGFAEEHGGGFTCHPTGTSKPATVPDREAVLDLIGRVDKVTAKVEVERMVLLSGRADHYFRAGSLEREWKESFARLHLSIVNASLRVTLDLGGPTLNEIDLSVIDRAATALHQATRFESANASILLTPNVSAALWPAMAMVCRGEPTAHPYGSLLWIDQTTHQAFSRDGDGLEIETVSCMEKERKWPNRYRPSYRYRPVPMPFHLRARPAGTRRGAPIQALGLIEPFRIDQGQVSARLLCHRPSSNQSFAAQLSLSFAELIGRIRYVGEQRTWFPYAAGSYGGEVELEELPLRD